MFTPTPLVALKDVIGQIHHLLGGATALDRRGWMGEQGGSPLEAADRRPSGGDVGVGIVADDADEPACRGGMK